MSVADDAAIPRLTELAQTINNGGAKGIVQLYHGGRLAVPRLTPNNETVSASNVAPLGDRGFYSIDQAPRPLTTEEVYTVIDEFGEATRRTIEAGFDGVELHGATGYLLQQFVSPHSNLRTDEFKNPSLFALKLIKKVKTVIAAHAVKSFAIGYRFSPEEPETPGITMTETFNLLNDLIEADIDYLHIAMTNAWAKARRGVESDKSRTELITEFVNGRVPIVGVGSVLTPDDALEVMEKGNTDFVALGRALVVNPYWVEKAEADQEDLIKEYFTENDQNSAVVPTPLWKLIMELDGWFPVRKTEKI